MALFMDFHEDLKLPPEAITQIADDTRAGRADQFGVRQVELYHNPDGKVYCLLEGPDEDAIRKHHAALGVPCSDVHQVTPLLDGDHPEGYDPMGDDRVVTGLVTRAKRQGNAGSAVAAVITLPPVPATSPARGHVSGIAHPGWEVAAALPPGRILRACRRRAWKRGPRGVLST